MALNDWKRWDNIEDEMLEQAFVIGSPVEQIAEVLHRTPAATKARARLIGVFHSIHNRAWRDEDDAVLIQEYSIGTPLTEIARKLGRSKNAVQIRAQKKELLHSSRGSYQETIRHDYFDDITTPLQAYLLGLLAADGALIDSNGASVIKLELHSRDVCLVERFRSAISPEMTIKTYSNKAYVSVHSKQLMRDLSKYNVVPRKSLILTWPQALPQEFATPFILGYFDGDGCLTRYKANNCLHWSLLGTKPFLEVAHQHICEQAQITMSGPRRHGKQSPHLYKIEVAGRKAEAVDRMLNASGLGLARKHLARLYLSSPLDSTISS